MFWPTEKGGPRCRSNSKKGGLRCWAGAKRGVFTATHTRGVGFCTIHLNTSLIITCLCHNQQELTNIYTIK